MKLHKTLKKIFFFHLILAGFSMNTAQAQTSVESKHKRHSSIPSPKNLLVKYGVASYYATKFHGRKTASGEIYRKELLSAACNILPLNTWVRITNLSNDISIIARINDRLHPQNKRLIDLSKSAAVQLGYVSNGLANVKVEVLKNYNPEEGILQN
jgi:rare lipoprotein A